MTPQPIEESAAGALHWLARSWQEALRKVVAISGLGQGLSWAPPKESDPSSRQEWSSPAWFRLELKAIPDASILLGCPNTTMLLLARLLAGDLELPEADCPEAFRELLNQAGGAVANAISSRLQQRVSFSAVEPAEAAPESSPAIELGFSLQEAAHAIVVAPSAAQIEAIAAAETAAVPVAAKPGPPAAIAVTAAASGNLEMLLEVELPVSITFGRTQLPLKEVLKLSSGSIVELNRMAHEPVELVINNAVIARGEVVVVEGNYGIRVTEIISRQERVRSIL